MQKLKAPPSNRPVPLVSPSLYYADHWRAGRWAREAVDPSGPIELRPGRHILRFGPSALDAPSNFGHQKRQKNKVSLFTATSRGKKIVRVKQNLRLGELFHFYICLFIISF